MSGIGRNICAFLRSDRKIRGLFLLSQLTWKPIKTKPVTVVPKNLLRVLETLGLSNLVP